MQNPPTTLTLTHAIIKQTIKLSPDHGRTLDFSHRNLCEIDEEGGRELAYPSKDNSQNEISVSRIAMSYNRLMALPSSFSLLTRLRYLNLRSNLFSSFPPILTTLPSLEILDISRNSIKSFPDSAGYLNNLQILSISKNKLTRLPTYLASFQKLTVFKVDHNPLEWPPPDVLDLSSDADDPQGMAQRLRNLRIWLEENSGTALTSRTHSVVHPKGADNLSGVMDTNTSVWSPPHSRSSSYDFVDNQGLNTSSSVCEGFEHGPAGMSSSETIEEGREDIDTSSNSSAPSQSSSFSVHYGLSTAETSSPPRPFVNDSLHTAQRASRPRSPGINIEKSLLDLRTVREAPIVGSLCSTNTYSPVTPPIMNGTISHFEESVASYELSSRQSDTGSLEHGAGAGRPISERNAYFKRFSTQLKPPVSKPISQALLSVVDSVRGIYFAIHQIYEQVDSYTSWTLDERISVILRKILEPAQIQISQIPLALDRFDSFTAHSSNPPVTVCRRVLESCRENIIVCGKVVAALQLHLKVLAGADDVRFTRSLVLMLYGSMAEITHAWQCIIPHMQAVKSYFSEARGIIASKPATDAGDVRVIANRSRNARRHAGSFSLRDVEIGRSMSTPPPDTIDQGNSSGFPTTQRQEHYDGHLESKAVYSPITLQPHHRAPAPQHLDFPDNSAKAIDRELLETISATVSSAQSLWEMLTEFCDNTMNNVPLPSKVLSTAKDITARLATLIKKVQGNSADVGGKQVFEETLTFIKTIAQVLLELKKADSSHPLPSSLRATTAKIAQLTKEIAVLLHVSSFSPNTSVTPTPYIGDDDGSSRPGILRSRSALTYTIASKSPQLEMPRSTLPHKFGL